MRLLFTVPWGERLGGAETMLWTFLRHIDVAVTQATVVCFVPGSFERELAELPGVETVIVPTGRLRHLRQSTRAIRQLAEVMRAAQPDLVINWAASAQIYGACAARLAGLGDRVIWWQHAIPSGHKMERAATLLRARAVGCSSTIAADAQAQTWPRRDVFVVNPGSEPRIVDPASHTELQIPPGRTIVGIVGRLQPWKGQHRVIGAVAELRDRGHDVHALIVGGDAHGLSPEYAPQLEELIDRLDLRDRVTLTGQVRDPLPYIRTMDVLVNASVGEPFGIVTIEGMSQGVPVIAVGDGGARDIIEHDRSGILLDHADQTHLTEAIERLIADPEHRARLAQAGRQRFCERFTAAAMAARLDSQLRALCSASLSSVA